MGEIYRHQSYLEMYACPERSYAFDFARQEPFSHDHLDVSDQGAWIDRLNGDSFSVYNTAIQFWGDNWQSWFLGDVGSLEATYHEGVLLAQDGDFDEARALWEADLEWANTPEAWVYVMENLCWLDLFSDDIGRLEGNAELLLRTDETNAVALYSLAYAAYRHRDYESVVHYLGVLNDVRPPCSDILAAQINELENKICGKLKMECTSDFFPYVHEGAAVSLMGKDEKGRFFNFTSYRNWTEGEKIDGLLGSNHDINSYHSFEKAFLDSLQADKITLSELPWLTHLYFRAAMNYEVDLSFDGSEDARSLDASFEDKKYDCTEYAESIARVLNKAGIQAVQVRYNQLWVEDLLVGHVFVAYQLNGKWGYLSPVRTKEPVFDSLEDALGDWQWDVLSGDFEIGVLETTGHFEFTSF